MNPTADRYAVVLWALREHHLRTRKWQATAAELAALLPDTGGNTDPARSIARTLSGMTAAGLVWSSHDSAKRTRTWRFEHDPDHEPYGAELALNRLCLYSTTRLGDTVNDMLDLVGNRDHLAGAS